MREKARQQRRKIKEWEEKWNKEKARRQRRKVFRQT